MLYTPYVQSMQLYNYSIYPTIRIMPPKKKKKPAKPRNYKAEYAKYHAKPKQKKRRAQRNAARSKMVKAGRARKGDGKDVDHKNRNTADNRSKNLRVVSKSKNRSFSRKKK